MRRGRRSWRQQHGKIQGVLTKGSGKPLSCDLCLWTLPPPPKTTTNDFPWSCEWEASLLYRVLSEWIIKGGFTYIHSCYLALVFMYIRNNGKYISWRLSFGILRMSIFFSSYWSNIFSQQSRYKEKESRFHFLTVC